MTDELPTQSAASLQQLLEQLWLTELKAGQEEAWQRAYEEYAGQLDQIIKGRLRQYDLPMEWAEDLQQQVWLSAIRSIDQFTQGTISQFEAWLSVIARNAVGMQLRQVNKRDKHEIPDLETDYEDDEEDGLFLSGIFMMQDNSPESLLILKENMALLKKVVETLKPRDQEIVWRHSVEKVPPRELALIYGVKPKTISMILVRTKHKLRDAIKTMSDNDSTRLL